MKTLIIPHADASATARPLYRLPIMLYRVGLGRLLTTVPIALLHAQDLTRHTPIPLVYRRHGNKLYVLSVLGEQAAWMHALEDAPQVTLRIGNRGYAAQGYRVTDTGEIQRVLYLFRRTAPVKVDTLLTWLSMDGMPHSDPLQTPVIVRFDLSTAVAPSMSPSALPSMPQGVFRVVSSTAALLFALTVIGAVLNAALEWLEWRKTIANTNSSSVTSTTTQRI
jgi:hypothetical protein